MGDWELVKLWNEQNNTLNSQDCYYSEVSIIRPGRSRLLEFEI